jgi:hypothetical protein
MSVEVCLNGSPPQQEEGLTRHQEEAAKRPLNGAAGVVGSRIPGPHHPVCTN